MVNINKKETLIQLFSGFFYVVVLETVTERPTCQKVVGLILILMSTKVVEFSKCGAQCFSFA